MDYYGSLDRIMGLSMHILGINLNNTSSFRREINEALFSQKVSNMKPQSFIFLQLFCVFPVSFFPSKAPF